MLAQEQLEAEIGPHGIPMDVATDRANQFRFVTPAPTVDWAAHTLAADQKAYYDLYDKDPKNPMNRAGQMWAVRLRTD